MIQLANQDLAENLKTRIEYKIGDACNINSMEDIGKFDLFNFYIASLGQCGTSNKKVVTNAKRQWITVYS